MALVQSNDVVEQVPSAAADPALSNTVLPRAPDGSLRGDDLHGSNRGWNFPSILCIVIKDEELGGRLIGEGLSQLLGNNHYQQPERADQPPERCGQWKLLYRARKYHALWVQSRRQGEMYLLGDLHTHEQGHHQGCHHHYRRCAHQPADRWLDWHGSVIVFAAKGRRSKIRRPAQLSATQPRLPFETRSFNFLEKSAFGSLRSKSHNDSSGLRTAVIKT